MSRLPAVLMIALVMVGHACAHQPPREAAAAAASVPTPDRRPQDLRPMDHLAPPRDSSGATPSRFAWTAVEGADRYVIQLWNEVDMLLWRQDDLQTTTVAWPQDLRVETGTYYWAVAALSNGRPIGDSGRAAFVVLR